MYCTGLRFYYMIYVAVIYHPNFFKIHREVAIGIKFYFSVIKMILLIAQQLLYFTEVIHHIFTSLITNIRTFDLLL